MEVKHLIAADFAPKPVLYEDWQGLLPKMEQQWKESRPTPLFLESPKGNGKSTVLHAFASAHKIPLIPCLCTEGMQRGHLVGYVNPEGCFIAGPLVTAILVANEV